MYKQMIQAKWGWKQLPSSSSNGLWQSWSLAQLILSRVWRQWHWWRVFTVISISAWAYSCRLIGPLVSQIRCDWPVTSGTAPLRPVRKCEIRSEQRYKRTLRRTCTALRACRSAVVVISVQSRDVWAALSNWRNEFESQQRSEHLTDTGPFSV